MIQLILIIFWYMTIPINISHFSMIVQSYPNIMKNVYTLLVIYTISNTTKYCYLSCQCDQYEVSFLLNYDNILLWGILDEV